MTVVERYALRYHHIMYARVDQHVCDDTRRATKRHGIPCQNGTVQCQKMSGRQPRAPRIYKSKSRYTKGRSVMATVLASQTRTTKVGKKAPLDAKVKAIDAAKKAEKHDDAMHPTTTTRGIKGMSDDDKRREIVELIDELRSATETDDKKRIRRALRARGHMGGLRQIDNPAETPTPPAKKAAATKRPRPAKKAATQSAPAA